MNDLLALLTPSLLALFGALLTWVINGAAAYIKVKAGVEIDAVHRDALHSALMTGAKAALGKGTGGGLDALKAEAIAYARESVPEAIAWLVPGDGVLDRLAERFVLEAMERVGWVSGEADTAA
ncbi:hypothetical protein [Pseudooceanicola nanhaiensis]|uniref:hypothetical protein n=1 Tax=Pseudooceanicola nanhaiensis TaxID=375761 RepID=UPI001CD46224|nr:hypothetical protein [Pseudooceanicola nanhaiensis]MCA0920213.1 hypothetical protein [Pseudooceanicola nanhaiensis]